MNVLDKAQEVSCPFNMVEWLQVLTRHPIMAPKALSSKYQNVGRLRLWYVQSACCTLLLSWQPPKSKAIISHSAISENDALESKQ